MPAQDSTTQNIDLAFEFARAGLESPEVLDIVPDGATVVFVPDDDPDIAERNIEAGMEAVRAGENIYFLHVASAERVPTSETG